MCIFLVFIILLLLSFSLLFSLLLFLYIIITIKKYLLLLLIFFFLFFYIIIFIIIIYYYYINAFYSSSLARTTTSGQPGVADTFPACHSEPEHDDDPGTCCHSGRVVGGGVSKSACEKPQRRLRNERVDDPWRLLPLPAVATGQKANSVKTLAALHGSQFFSDSVAMAQSRSADVVVEALGGMMLR